MEPITAGLKTESVFEEDEDQFYEEIEAPKFVDLRVPDRSRPDDKFWFCVRVGCDQQHEELEVDPDALHRSFVLRVMAARSPNLHLRKALSRQAPSAIPKCPHSAPAKSTKDRPQKLGITTSIPGKIRNTRLREDPISSMQSTPNHAKSKEQLSIADKALTTPRNKRLPPKGDPFLSVRNPKVHVPVLKNKKVAKALVFSMTNKNEKIAALNSVAPIAEMCIGIKELDIGRGKKHVSRHLCRPSQSARHDPNYSKPASVSAQLQKNGSKTIRRGEEGSVKTKKSKRSITKEGVCIDASDLRTDRPVSSLVEPPMEWNLQSVIADSTKFKHSDEGSVNPKKSDQPVTKDEDSIGTSDLKTDKPLPSMVQLPIEVNVHSVVADGDSLNNPIDRPKLPEKKLEAKSPIHPSDGPRDEKRLKENSSDTHENKENALTTWDNREMTPTIINPETENIQLEINKHPSKTVESPTKAYKGRSMQGGRYRRIKPTNPKPFRLRTDERGILKEANMERRLQIGDARTEPDTRGQDELEYGKVKETKKLKDKSPKLAKSRHLIKHQSKAAEREKGTCRSTLKSRERATLKSQSGNTNSRIIIPSRYKMSTTVPKEPIFQRTHMPKNCTKRSEKAR